MSARRGFTITRQSAELLAKDRRDRRFNGYVPERVEPEPIPGIRGVRHFVTPTGGLPAFNNTTKQLGSASCREWIPNSSGVLVDSTLNETIWNQYTAIAAGVFVLVGEADDGRLIVIQEPRFDVRIKPDKSALQKSYDGGATWTDWATIGPCT